MGRRRDRLWARSVGLATSPHPPWPLCQEDAHLHTGFSLSFGGHVPSEIKRFVLSEWTRSSPQGYSVPTPMAHFTVLAALSICYAFSS